jgi:hypothetical protein
MHAYANKSKRIQIAIALCGLLAANFLFLAHAHASTYMTHASVTEYNMNASGSSSVVIAFTAGAADAAGTLTVNFGSWGGTVAATQTVATTGCTAMTGATNALPGSLTAAGAGSVITLSSVGVLTSGQSYCAVLTSTTAVTNPAAGVYPVILTDASDTATSAIDVITNDQVVVSATVPATFTMALSGNTDTLGSLSSTTLSTSGGVTATISTNGNYGWYLWAEDSYAGLHSTSQAKTIATVATGSNVIMNGAKLGTEAYALGVTTADATTNYADAGGITGGGLSTTAYNEIASGNAAVSGATATVKELADISATTPAATDYSDTVSLVGAGSF